MPGKLNAEDTVRQAHGLLREQQNQMQEHIRQLVEMESPSGDRAAATKLQQFLAERLTREGANVTLHPGGAFADHVQADFPGRDGKPILLLGHYDTVWEVGTLAKMPCRIEDGRMHGPGIFDMKAGIELGLAALRALRTVKGELRRPVTMLLNADEEVGSESSRPVTEALARGAEAVLVLEPSAGPQGAVKTSRKGVGDYTITVNGVASHSGLDFEKGHSAILELARQLLEVEKFTDLPRGLTVNPGVIRGGTRTNVVAAEAVAEVDLRIQRMDDAPAIDAKFKSLRPHNPHCQVHVTGGVNRPPLERTSGVTRLYELARELARPLGVELQEIGVGGGSDGNFTAGLGIPTLDGLGAIGDGAHATHEHIVLAELPRRAALIGGLIMAI